MTLRAGLRTFAVAGLVLVGAVGCGGSDDSSGLASGTLAGDLQAAAKADGEKISDDEATCFADLLVNVLGESGATEAVEQGADGIEDAMAELSSTMLAAGGGDSSATAMVGRLAAMDAECLTLLGLDPADLQITGGTGGGTTDPYSAPGPGGTADPYSR